MFDGRTRYDLKARRLGEERARRDGREVAAQRIELTPVPKAGFDDNEVFGSRVDPDQPWAELLVTRDGDPIPLRITAHGRPGWRIVLDEG